MNVKNTKDIIIDVINQDINCKSILIDGSWGCGKTTIIKEALDELKQTAKSGKKKVIYQSLFGIKDIGELTACFSKVGKIIYSAGVSIASPFTKLIPLVGEQIHDGLENLTSLYTPNEHRKKNIVFIFDDLERTDPSFSYVSLIGLFNQLIMRGCLIICISSLGDLSKIDLGNRRDIELSTFAEKAFDRIFFINESPDDVICDLFKDLDAYSKHIRPCIGMFEKNIRLAIKAHRLLCELLKNKDKHNYNFSKLPEPLLLKSLICSIRAIYLNPLNINGGKNQKKQEPNTDPLSDTRKCFDETVLKQKIESEINNNFQYYSSEEKETIKDTSISFSFVELYNDYSKVIFAFGNKKKTEEMSNSIIDISVFYLNDEDKERTFQLFKEDVLKGRIDVNKPFIEKLIDLIKYTDFDFKQDGLYDCLTDSISKHAIKNNGGEALERLYDYVHFPIDASNNKASEIIKNLYLDVSTIFENKKKEELKETVDDKIKNGDYSEMLDIIYDVSNYKKPIYIREMFDKLLIENDFYLPDLSTSLNYYQWSYCHQVAKYVSNKEDFKNSFIDALKKQISKHNNSKSAKEKAIALLEYNGFGDDCLNDFKNYIEAKQ